MIAGGKHDQIGARGVREIAAAVEEVKRLHAVPNEVQFGLAGQIFHQLRQ